MMALAKEQQKIEVRKAYIQSALISFREGMALVKSQHESGYHLVHIENGKAIDCDCGDFRYRKAFCKHREAVELRMARPKKTRRSASNAELIASLRVADGVKVRKVRRKQAIVVNAPKAEEVMHGDMTVAEHFLEEEMTRYERDLQDWGITQLRKSVEVNGLTVKSKSKSVLIAALVGHRRTKLMPDNAVQVPAKCPVDVPRVGNLNGNRDFSRVLLFSKRA